MPASDEQMIASVEAYIENFNKGDFQAIAGLYAADATVEDPIGTPVKDGNDAIRDFYEGAVQTGSQLALAGPVRVAGKEVAFAFVVSVDTPDAKMTIDVIDTMAFDDDGKISKMRAYWGEKNVSVIS